MRVQRNSRKRSKSVSCSNEAGASVANTTDIEQLLEIVEASFLSQRRQLRCNVHCKGKAEQIRHMKTERQLNGSNCCMMQFAVLRNRKEARTVG